MNRTFVMIKPDAIKKQLAGNIITMLEDAGLKVVAMKMERLTKEKAERFYAVHNERPFYNDLVAFMTSGPVIPIVVEGAAADIVKFVRTKMGATDSKKADLGTVRQKYGTDIECNAIHGSDSLENAATEMAFFFNKEDIIAS